MRNFLIGLLVCAVIPATVHAGGNGGTKPTSFIKIKNTDGSQIAVIVDPPAVIPVNLNDFRNAGGKILNTNETATFNVREGQHVIAAAFLNGQAPGVIGQTNVSVGRGRTVNFTTNGNPTFAPVLTRR
jgi:hypothetical protein